MQIVHTLAEASRICKDRAGIPVCPSAGNKGTVRFSNINASLLIRHCSLHRERIKAELEICLSLCFIDKISASTKYSSLHGNIEQQKALEKDVGMNFFIHSHNIVPLICLHFLLLSSRSNANHFRESSMRGNGELP